MKASAKKKKIRVKRFKPREFERDLRFITDFSDRRNRLRLFWLLGILFGLGAIIVFLLSLIG